MTNITPELIGEFEKEYPLGVFDGDVVLCEECSKLPCHSGAQTDNLTGE